ncbi:MAG TPA: hypothetical protein VGE39_18250 [Prosthecobacter sp.]
MPACQIEDYHDTPQARAELVSWLVATGTGAGALSGGVWHERLSHWWDKNPFAEQCVERGWTLRHEGRMVGFMALIPACYAVRGQATPAFMASTWRVDEPHRNASLPMFMKMRGVGRRHLIVDTTPTPQVQEIMRKCGWRSCLFIQRCFVALGLLGRLVHGNAWPPLRPGCRVTTDLGEVRSLAACCQSAAGVEKWITLDYLRWFAASPMREHVFVGVVNEAGCLSTYMYVTPARVRGVPAWMELDHFTSHPGNEELHALVGAIVHGGVLPGGRLLLSLAAFPDDATWTDARVLYRRAEHLCHYFLIPEELKALPKRTVLAEGDWGL